MKLLSDNVGHRISVTQLNDGIEVRVDSGTPVKFGGYGMWYRVKLAPTLLVHSLDVTDRIAEMLSALGSLRHDIINHAISIGTIFPIKVPSNSGPSIWSTEPDEKQLSDPSQVQGPEEFMPCKFCESTKARLIEVTRKINRGDSVIYPHMHFNLLYNCSQCRNNFVVRMQLSIADYFRKLYYGDIIDRTGIVDMSPDSQDDLAIQGVHELRTTRLTEKCKAVREFVQYLDENAEALDYGFF